VPRRSYRSAHGEPGDPRYPSPRRLRTVLAFVVDLALSLAGLAGGFLAFGGRIAARLGPLDVHYAAARSVHFGVLSRYPGLGMLCALLAVSFANRVLVQWIARATVGKALFALCVVRPSDGRRPTLRQYVTSWLLSFANVADLAGGAATGAGAAHRFPAAVRMRDVRAIKRHTPAES